MTISPCCRSARRPQSDSTPSRPLRPPPTHQLAPGRLRRLRTNCRRKYPPQAASGRLHTPRTPQVAPSRVRWQPQAPQKNLPKKVPVSGGSGPPSAPRDPSGSPRLPPSPQTTSGSLRPPQSASDTLTPLMQPSCKPARYTKRRKHH